MPTLGNPFGNLFGAAGGVGGTVTQAGAPLEIVRDFDSLASDGRAIIVQLPTSPDPTGATPELRIFSRSYVAPKAFAGQIVQVDGAPHARFELTKAQTATLDATFDGIAGNIYQVAVTLPNSHFVLMVEGEVTIK